MRERGAAHVEVLVRKPAVVWLRGHGVKKRIGRLGPIVYAPTDVGPLWYSRLVEKPGLFRHLPREAQDKIAARSIRPACSHFVRVRLGEVAISTGVGLRGAQQRDGQLRLSLSDGSEREVDHLMLGTGYKVDVARYAFLGRRHPRGHPSRRRLSGLAARPRDLGARPAHSGSAGGVELRADHPLRVGQLVRGSRGRARDRRPRVRTAARRRAVIAGALRVGGAGGRTARALAGRSGAPGAVVIGGDYQGLGIVRSLGRRGVDVLVVDDERSIAATRAYDRGRARAGAA